MSRHLNITEEITIERGKIQSLLDILSKKGFQIIGPTVRDHAVVYDEISSVTELPEGWIDEQSGGNYRLKQSNGKALFGYTNSPQSWKKYLLTPSKCLLRIEKDRNGFHVAENDKDAKKLAFFGVRPCELCAITLQDKALIGHEYGDPIYAARRKNTFIIAANCGQAGGTCFCLSMDTGPKATTGFDLAMTEVIESGRHYFVLQAGTEEGTVILKEIPHEKSTEAEQKAAEKVVATTARHMGRTLDTKGIKELLYRNHENPHWDKIASRCLSCANCTMVCPTCFCTTVQDTTDLVGKEAQRTQKWDSCFTMDFSYIHGGSIRASAKSRYRQWMTHKLSSWYDQFGASGCVGCGRCITWCPVAIDITEEARAIRESELNKMTNVSIKEK